MRQELCTELSSFGRELQGHGRKMGLPVHHWTGILECHVHIAGVPSIWQGSSAREMGVSHAWTYQWQRSPRNIGERTSICPWAHACALKTRLVLRLGQAIGLQLERWGAWLGGLWGRRKVGNDWGSRLPADDKLQLLVGAFHQGDGLSPGAAQLHLIDVHHFITSLQLGRQRICLPSLFNLHRREGRKWDMPDTVWLSPAELRVCFCSRIDLPAPNTALGLKKPFASQLTQRSVLATSTFLIEGSLESAARWALPRSTA